MGNYREGIGRKLGDREPERRDDRRDDRREDRREERGGVDYRRGDAYEQRHQRERSYDAPRYGDESRRGERVRERSREGAAESRRKGSILDCIKGGDQASDKGGSSRGPRADEDGRSRSSGSQQGRGLSSRPAQRQGEAWLGQMLGDPSLNVVTRANQRQQQQQQ